MEEYYGEEEDLGKASALKLKWALGLNYHIYDGVHNLTNRDRKEVFIPVANQGVIYDYENNLQRQLQGHVLIRLDSATKSQPPPTIKLETSSSLQIPEKIQCWWFGTSIVVPLAKPSSALTRTELRLWISVKMGRWSWPLVGQTVPLSNGSPCGNGKKRNLATLQQRWTKKLTACKGLLSSTMDKTNLSLQEKQEFCFGCGRTVKGDLSCILLRFLPRKPSLKQCSFQIPLRLFREQRKAWS